MRVSFHHGATDRLEAAADWLENRSPQDATVLVQLPTEELAEQLDRMLWGRSALSFTPHCPAHSPLADDTPIIFSADHDYSGTRGCLLNLANTMPQQHANCQHLIEIISLDEDERALARERYRTYRSLGYAIESIDLSKSTPP